MEYKITINGIILPYLFDEKDYDKLQEFISMRIGQYNYSKYGKPITEIEQNERESMDWMFWVWWS